MKGSMKQIVTLLFTACFVICLHLGVASAANTALPMATPAPAKAAALTEKINVNTATAEQLDKIPGVGPKTANAIIQYRTQNGNFKTMDDLIKVKGIGPNNIKKIAPYLSL